MLRSYESGFRIYDLDKRTCIKSLKVTELPIEHEFPLVIDSDSNLYEVKDDGYDYEYGFMETALHLVDKKRREEILFHKWSF